MTINIVALVATVTLPQRAAEIQEIPKAVTWLQIRSDLIGDVPGDWLRSYFPGNLLYTLQSCRAGGKFDRSMAERHRRLAAAAKDYDLVELESDSDLQPELLDAIPAAKRMIVWRGEACDVSRLHLRFQQIAEVPARYYGMITSSARTGQGLQLLLLLKSLNRRDVIAYCAGPSGVWSQLLCPSFGAPLLFGRLDNCQPGELRIQQLIEDYGFPTVAPVREIYGMVGNQIFQSPSPRLHNGAFRKLNQSALFLPFYAERFDDFWKEIVESETLDLLGTPVRGLVIVSPHKEAAAAVAGVCSVLVRRAQSSNVFVRRDGIWEAETTDPESIAGIRHLCPVKAAVIGCGGAGRAVAAALQQSGSEVTLVNRGPRRGAYAVELLGLPFIPLAEFRANDFNLIVNATPVGKYNEGLPFVIDGLGDGALVIDLVYGSHTTPLVSATRARGGTAIDGYDVLLTQVRRQFQLMTGLEMPEVIDRKAVLAGRTGNLLSSEDVLQTAQGMPEACECSS
jgi:3-dehydroquinate dehydratase/shikimate dehydrogenase